MPYAENSSRKSTSPLDLELLESEARYRTLFDLVPVAVYTCDAAGVIQNFNRRAAELWGRSPAFGDTDERFCGSYKLFRPDGTFMPHHLCPMAEVVSGTLAEVRDAEVLIERPDGSRITVIVNIRPQKTQDGALAGAINCFYDITDRKRGEEALRDADRNKSEFFSMLAHELRNPLAPILFSIEILRLARNPPAADGVDLNESIDQALKVLTRQVRQMVRLVDDLLDAARINRGKIHLRNELVDVASVVLNTVDVVRPLCDDLQQELSVSIPSDPLFLDADPARIAQIVGNLLNNACKFTPRGGHVWLTVEREEMSSQVVIRVRDTGVGIGADQFGRIFDIFTQLDTSLERSSSGLGIGLALVKTLTELHGGTVGVSSAGIGQGSEFVVRLPILADQDALAIRPTTSDPAVVTPLRILIVDDSRDSADMLATLLSLSGHETHTAHDGHAAVQAASNLQPDVIFLDIGLPALNGYEAARKIREQHADNAPVLVALTGWGQDDDRSRSAKAGFDAHLVKPVDDGALGKLLMELGAKSRRSVPL